MSEFVPFQKIGRLSREVIITEKIDGTNGVIEVGGDTAHGERLDALAREITALRGDLDTRDAELAVMREALEEAAKICDAEVNGVTVHKFSFDNQQHFIATADGHDRFISTIDASDVLRARATAIRDLALASPDQGRLMLDVYNAAMAWGGETDPSKDSPRLEALATATRNARAALGGKTQTAKDEA